MKIFKTENPIEAIRFAQDCITNSTEGLDVFFNTSTFLQTGITNTSDRALAQQMGIPVWEAKHIGGSIVCFPGDLSICMFWQNGNDKGHQWMQDCAKLLKQHGAQEVILDENDVLADGKKVASWANAALQNGWIQTVAHFSVNIDLDLIKLLCTKPMLKIPGALSDYGITAEELYKEVIEKNL